MILSMTHQPYHGRLATMIARGKPVLACPECQTIHRRDRRATVLLKSWSHGWRITCPVCSSRLQEITEGKIYPPANAFDHVWDEARNGEEMLAGIDQLPTDRAAFAVALLHLLLLPRSRTRNDVQRQIWRGRVLDVVIPGFDDVDRHAPSPSILRRRSWRRYLSVSLCSRGFGEHKTTPICTTGSRALAVEERAFDSTPRKSNCSPTLIRHSHICSKFENSSPFWSRYFLQRKRRTAPSLKISCNVTAVAAVRSQSSFASAWLALDCRIGNFARRQALVRGGIDWQGWPVPRGYRPHIAVYLPFQSCHSPQSGFDHGDVARSRLLSGDCDAGGGAAAGVLSVDDAPSAVPTGD